MRQNRPLSRAKQTAEIIASVLQKPVTVIDSLKEYCSGIAQGKPVESKEQRLERRRLGKIHEGAELVQDFESRIISALTQALKLPRPVLVVSHGIVYANLAKLIGLPYASITNCAILYHEPPASEGKQWQVSIINDKIGSISE